MHRVPGELLTVFVILSTNCMAATGSGSLLLCIFFVMMVNSFTCSIIVQVYPTTQNVYSFTTPFRTLRCTTPFRTLRCTPSALYEIVYKHLVELNVCFCKSSYRPQEGPSVITPKCVQGYHNKPTECKSGGSVQATIQLVLESNMFYNQPTKEGNMFLH